MININELQNYILANLLNYAPEYPIMEIILNSSQDIIGDLETLAEAGPILIYINTDDLYMEIQAYDPAIEELDYCTFTNQNINVYILLD